MSDLMGCRYCGSEAKEGPQNPKEEGDAWRFIRCENDLCGVRPEVVVREDSCAGPDGEGPWLDSPAEIREEAKRRWNAPYNAAVQGPERSDGPAGTACYVAPIYGADDE